MKSRLFAMALAALAALALFAFTQTASAPATQEAAQQAPAPQPAPMLCIGNFSSHEEAEEFLRTAKITKRKGIPVGITGPTRLTLEKDGRQESAVFKDVDVHKQGITQLPSGPEVDFKDSWKYEVAAYELDKLLNLHMVPVTVERSYGNRKGSLQLFMDSCITELERTRKNLQPPGPMAWRQQIFKLRVFDNLIYNIDRNLGNMLIDSDWKVLLIDHGRTFKNLGEIRAPKDLTFFSRSLMESMKGLDEKTVEEHCGKWLSGLEIRTMLQRRDKILEMYEAVKDTPGMVYP